MMEDREASKTRGRPAGFQKSQLSNGAKPGWMGRDKDWPMPKELPKAKTDADTEKVKKSDDVKEPKEPKETEGVKKEYTDAFGDMMGHADKQVEDLVGKYSSSRLSAWNRAKATGKTVRVRSVS